jgi:hypothetical protein
MAKSTQQQLDEAVIRLVRLLVEEHGPYVDRVSVYPAHSGEYPYQVEVRGENLPLAGLATDAEHQTLFAAADNSTSREVPEKGGTSG